MTDKAALDWFRRNDKFWFGNSFPGFEGELRKIVEEQISGTRIDKSERVKNLRSQLEKFFPSKSRFYKTTIDASIQKARNFSRTLEYEALGFHTIMILAVIDKKTSKVCRIMNGRRITVKTAANYVRSVMASDPEEMKEKFGWDKINVEGMLEGSLNGKSSEEILDLSPVKLPPYHGGCRSDTIVGDTDVEVKAKNGKKITGELNGDGRVLKREKDIPRGKEYDKARKAFQHASSFSAEELVAQVAQNRDAYLSKESAAHILEKHRSDFGNEAELNQFVKDLTGKFERAYVYYYYDRFMREFRHQWAFAAKNIKGFYDFMAIDNDDGHIRTAYRNMEKFPGMKNGYLRIL